MYGLAVGRPVEVIEETEVGCDKGMEEGQREGKELGNVSIKKVVSFLNPIVFVFPQEIHGKFSGFSDNKIKKLFKKMLTDVFLFWLVFSLFVPINGANSKLKYEDRYKIKHWPNQEVSAINRALQTIPDEIGLFQYRKPLVCVTFLNASNVISRKILHTNLLHSKSMCDWAIVIYAGRRPTLCRSKMFHTHIRHCAPPLFPETVKHRANMTVLPKSLLYFDLLSFLWEYQYAFLLDEDISLDSFNFTSYQRVLKSAFQSSQCIWIRSFASNHFNSK